MQDQSKFKTLADNTLCVAQIRKTLSNSIENIVGKGDNDVYKHFLLFPQRFQKTLFLKSLNVGILCKGVKDRYILYCLLGFSPFSKFFSFIVPNKMANYLVEINPFPNKPWFLRVCSIRLLKTLWEKEKLLVTRNFSFSQCFLPIWSTFLPFSSNLKLSSANSFSLEGSRICHLGKG